MNRGCLIFIFLLLFPLSGFSQAVGPNWVVHHPFEHKVFIENNGGQFDTRNGYNSNKVLYSAYIAGVQLYFTAKGIIYRYDKYPKISRAERERQEHNEGKNNDIPQAQPKTYYFVAQWQDANSNVEVIAKDEVSFYYCYPVSTKHTIIAHAFKKLLYKNIYPGIDIEYSLTPPSGGRGATLHSHTHTAFGPGIEYSIIVHPGADLSKVKLLYKGAKSIKQDKEGALIMQSAFGPFIAYSPARTYYKEDNIQAKAKFIVNITPSPNGEGRDEVSFTATYNHAKTIVIDPWVTNPAFAGKDAAYDLCYDNNGNVYIYGGGLLGHFTLAKLNNLGAIQWLFTTSFPFSVGYGDFAVDKTTGISYIGDASFYGLIGPIVYKVNTSGIKIDTVSIGMRMPEIWRMEYNQCRNNIVIAGGNPFTPSNSQATILDTNLTVVSSFNVLGAHQGYHDMALLSIDNTGNYCYMASSMQPGADSIQANNTLLKCPLPALAPNLLFIPDGYRFIESGNNYYVNGDAIGMNGMCNSPNWVYLYDGYTLKRFNKSSGVLMSIKSINAPKYNGYDYIMLRWGGIDADNCDNIYIGDKNQIDIIDSSFNGIGTIPMDSVTDTVYDLHIAPGNLLYACGDGFAASYTIASPPPLTLNITKTPACSGCTGTATALVGGCGNKNSTYSYQWSSGQTTQFASGLCPGNYTVTVFSHCKPVMSDTVTIDSSSKPSITININQTNESCYGQNTGSASVTITGGSGVYSYLWSPSVDSVSSVSNLSAGSYTITVTDTNGCAGIAPVTITEPPPLFSTITTVNDSCYGQTKGAAAIVVSGGTIPYDFIWNPGGINGFTDTGLSAGTYSVTTTDSNGCTLVDTVTITQPPLLTLSDSVRNVQCYGLNNGYIAVNVNGGRPAYLYYWQPYVAGASNIADNLPAGVYTCTVEDYYGCTDSITATIAQPPQITLTTFSSGNIYPGQEVTLSANATGGIPPYNYIWSNGDNGQDIKVMPATTTIYTVTVSDSAGCKLTDTVTIDVENCPAVFVPNAFSPNNDGYNDILYVRSPCINTMDFVIYDRWGNKVFESESESVGWDGTYKGQPMNTGTYVWYLKAMMNDGSTVEKKGNVALVR